jgi:predicted dienelactone hydrolase
LDFCEARAQALLDASAALQKESARAGSALLGRLDTSSRAVQGYSLGGGGAQLAALRDPTLKCIVAICPSDGSALGETFPAALSPSVPALFVCGESDSEAPPQAHAWAQYRKTGGAKLLFEVRGGNHHFANGPAGNATEAESNTGAFDMALLCNCMCAILSQGACVPCPCPCGTANGSGGHARADTPRGAVGVVALAWLRLFLLRDETARSQLATCPGIARSFESSGIEAATAAESRMERG